MNLFMSPLFLTYRELFRENIEEKGQYISSIITSAVEFKIDSS